MASNGPESFGLVRQLEFALNDAVRVSRTLSSALCGFDVRCPSLGSPTKDVIDDLELVCDSCLPEDSFVCYFSGHGVLDVNGNLLLLWDHSDPRQVIRSTISVKKVMTALEACRAKNRLLVLDCCHAGAVVNMTGLKGAAEASLSERLVPPDNYAVIMASGRLDSAKELKHLERSFFTDAFCAALSESFKEADKDKDGRVSIADLGTWIADRAIRHNDEFPDDPVPYPSVFGKYRGDFFLTVNLSDWEPWLIDWANDAQMVVLPVRDRENWEIAFCLGRTPVTNAQYHAFVDAANGSKPVGEHFILSDHENRDRRGQWSGPFYPWEDPAFNSPSQPVVCVSLEAGQEFAAWVNSMSMRSGLGGTALPSPQLWDFGAFGTPFPNRDPRQWLRSSKTVHHRSQRTADTGAGEDRTSRFGLRDMIGNVWEWCLFDEPRRYATFGPSEPAVASLRGGGFLDDLTEVDPFFDPLLLPEGTQTSHSDLGLRLAGLVRVDTLPKRVQERLSACEVLEGLFTSIAKRNWRSLFG
jgi:hypothetical protein